MILQLCAVFLYGDAATVDYRRTVPQIRAGEYEGLTDKVYYLKVYILYSCEYLKAEYVYYFNTHTQPF